MSTLTLKSWLFSKRTTNDEKAQPWGLILFLSNLILFFLLGLRRFFKQRLAYGICSGVIWASTLSTIVSLICFLYLMNQVI